MSGPGIIPTPGPTGPTGATGPAGALLVAQQNLLPGANNAPAYAKACVTALSAAPVGTVLVTVYGAGPLWISTTDRDACQVYWSNTGAAAMAPAVGLFLFLGTSPDADRTPLSLDGSQRFDFYYQV